MNSAMKTQLKSSQRPMTEAKRTAAPARAPAPEWDPYQVWKRELAASPAPMAAAANATQCREGPWNPYQVWASHVARKG